MKNTRRSMSSAALNVAAPKRVESSVLSGKSARDGLCQFPFTDGRTCRMPIAENHPCLCLFHSRDERQLLASQEVPARLASLSGHFKTASDINHVLGQLFRLVAENRIPRRDALALAYIAQLLLQTLPHVRAEISEVHTADGWEMTLQEVLCPKWLDDSEREHLEQSAGNPPSPPLEEVATTAPSSA